MRLTANGRALVIAAVVLLVVGWLAGYNNLVALAAALGVSLLVAFAIVSRRTTIQATRNVVPDRVVAGGNAESVLTITNTATTRSGPGTVRERIGNQEVPVELPALEPGHSTVVRRSLPTDIRGVFSVGPLSVRQGDPLGLLLRGSNEHDISRLIVHPFVHPVSPFPAGVTRDLDGSPSGESSEGGIAFSGLREYVPGDDLRLIHWRSAAKTGELMVRYNVDSQRPRTAVILDTRAALHDEESFEDAVRAAASVASAAIARNFPFTIRTTCGRVIDDRASRTAVMDMFAEIQVDIGGTDLVQAARLAAHDPVGLSLACITGAAGLTDLGGLGPLRARYEQLTIIRTGGDVGSGIFELGGAVLINAETSEDFARAWNRRIRR